MSAHAPDTIALITIDDNDVVRSDVTRLVTKTLPVEALRARFQKFMTVLQAIIAVQESTAGPFNLAEVQFKAEIAADGEFKLLGTGVGARATSAVTFVLKR